MIHTEKLTLDSDGHSQCFNITEQVRAAVKASRIVEGQALVYYCHTTGAVLIAEHEAGILVDLDDALEIIVPAAGEYKHHLRGYDLNGSAHLRAALLGVSVAVPVLDGNLLMGEYQEILIVDMEPQARLRNFVVQVMGE